jgi:hypothetical protein
MRAAWLLPVVLCVACPVPGTGGSTSSSSGNASSSSGGGRDAGPHEARIELGALCRELRAGFRASLLRTVNQCGAAYVDQDLELIDTSIFDVSVAASLSQVQSQLPAASCDQFGNLRIYMDHVTQSVDRGRVAYNDVNAFKCRAASSLPVVARKDRPPVAQGAFSLVGVDLPPVCHEVFEGLVPAGGTCDLTHECANRLHCRPMADDTSVGTCVAPVPVGSACDSRDECEGDGLCVNATCREALHAGELCVDAAGTQQPCGAGLVCLGGVCAAYGAEGTLCGGTQAPCMDGLLCTRQTLQDATRRCRFPVATGGVCKFNEQCANCNRCTGDGRCVPFLAGLDACDKDHDACGPGLRCGEAGVCVMQPREGEPCRALFVPSSSTRGNCLYTHNTCARATETDVEGVCRPYPSHEGQSCGDGPDTHPTCVSGPLQLSCDRDLGTCVRPARLDEECSPAGSPKPRCENGYCQKTDATSDRGRCALLPRVGEPCGTDGVLAPSCQGSFCRREADAGNGTCAAYPDIGQPCGPSPSGSTYCVYGTCLVDPGNITGLCGYERDPGQACHAHSDCRTGDCDPHLGRCVTAGQSCQGCSRFEPILFILSLGLVIRRRKNKR